LTGWPVWSLCQVAAVRARMRCRIRTRTSAGAGQRDMSWALRFWRKLRGGVLLFSPLTI